MNVQTFTVSELNGLIKSLFDNQALFDNVCVTGELSNYKIYPSGHHYFTLKDSQSSLKCVMFKPNAMKLRFKPENGMAVAAFGRISVYPRDGAYQLYCNSVSPQGAGDLQVAFEQLKRKLGEEGLFDEDHKKPLPEFPDCVGIITSSAGAAVHDIIRILAARWPMSKVVLLPVSVQGERAPAEIVGAINYANRYNVADVLICGRGGGSIEDLWAFNDERVARAVYASRIPIISAVGHEPDVTISDYVADVRASTPSNGAEKAVPDFRDYSHQLDIYEKRIIKAYLNKITGLKERLNFYGQKRVLQDPMSPIDDRRLSLDRVKENLCALEERDILEKKQIFIKLCAGLDAMSPLKVLSRGYSVATDAKGSIIKSSSDLKKGDDLNLKLSEGDVKCSVEEILD